MLQTSAHTHIFNEELMIGMRGITRHDMGLRKLTYPKPLCEIGFELSRLQILHSQLGGQVLLSQVSKEAPIDRALAEHWRILVESNPL